MHRGRKTEAPDRSPVLARWRTDRRLKITRSSRDDSLPADVIAPVGRPVPLRIHRPAHRVALHGQRAGYVVWIGGRAYEAEVLPLKNRQKRIVGTQGTLRAREDSSLAVCGQGHTLRSALRTLDLAHTVLRTAKNRATFMVQKAEAERRQTEEALLRVETEERRSRLLLEAGSSLELLPDRRQAQERLGDLLTRTFADGFVLYLDEGNASCRVVLSSRGGTLWDILEQAFPLRLEDPGSGGARPGGSEFMGVMTPGDLDRVIGDHGRADALRAAGIQSLIRVAIKPRGRVIGRLYLLSMDPGRAFDLADLRMAENLAARIGMAEDSAALYAEAQREIALRKEAEARLRAFNADLERVVAERTKLLQEAIREANDFAYTVAHDLRAPLRAMTGFCQALREDYKGIIDAVGQDYLDRIVGGSRRMDDLIRDLLEYSRLSRSDLVLEPVDLDALLRTTLERMNDDLQHARARIFPEPLGTVVGHGPILGQVVANLVGNAVKFVAPGVTPEVRIRCEARDGRRRVYVEDNGIGIAPQYHERIFGIFERLNLVEDYPGTGIGLAIVRRALERLGGSVGVDSVQGAGSKFWFELAEPAKPAP